MTTKIRLAAAVPFLSLLTATGTGAQQPSLDIEMNEALAAAWSATSPRGLEAARDELLELSRRYPRRLYPEFPGRSRALVEAATLGRVLGVGNAAAGELLQVLEREPESEWTARAHLELAELVLAAGDWELAADHLWRARQAALLRAAGDGDQPGDEVAVIALERMTRIDRLILRPLAGKKPWTRTRIVLPPNYLPEKQQLKRPRAIAAGPRGEVLVADDSRIVQLGPEWTPETTRQMRGLTRPSFGQAGPLGGLVPVVPSGNTVMRLDDPSPTRLERPSGGRLEQIVTAFRGPYGNWTVLSRQVDVVLRYDPQGRLLDFGAATLARPVDMALGPNGTILVLDAGNGDAPPALLTFRPDGQLEATLSANWRRPTALDVDRFGNAYVLEERAKQVLVYDPDGRPIATLGPMLPGNIELRAPSDIAVDGMGRIFIAERRLNNVVALE